MTRFHEKRHQGVSAGRLPSRPTVRSGTEPCGSVERSSAYRRLTRLAGRSPIGAAPRSCTACSSRRRRTLRPPAGRLKHWSGRTSPCVPAKLGACVERLLTGLTTPPSGSFLGWSTDDRIPPRRWLPWRRARPVPLVLPEPLASARRRRTEPDWGYRIDFQPDVGTVAPAGSRSVALHQTAIKLRAESGWSFMRCIVGRNNLGDLEFVASGIRCRGRPNLVQQSAVVRGDEGVLSRRRPHVPRSALR